jgi:hypothetical protein
LIVLFLLSAQCFAFFVKLEIIGGSKKISCMLFGMTSAESMFPASGNLSLPSCAQRSLVKQSQCSTKTPLINRALKRFRDGSLRNNYVKQNQLSQYDDVKEKLLQYIELWAQLYKRDLTF